MGFGEGLKSEENNCVWFMRRGVKKGRWPRGCWGMWERRHCRPGFDASGDQKLGGGAFDELVEATVGEAKLARDRYMVGQMGNILATWRSSPMSMVGVCILEFFFFGVLHFGVGYYTRSIMTAAKSPSQHPTPIRTIFVFTFFYWWKGFRAQVYN